MSTIDTGKAPQKRALTQEDKAFLTALQHVLRIQPADDTREPRYWVIQVTERIYGVAADEADGWFLYDTETPELTVGHPNDSQSVYDEVSGRYTDEDLDENPDLIDALFELKEAADEDNPGAMADLINDRFYTFDSVCCRYYRLETTFVRNQLFLTKDECEAYIKAHKYDFDPNSHPRSYSMCASQDGAYGHLLEILKNVDWFNA
ncbi:hypothetical protein [uncultured Megasphaera sp.]|uniref:hypothetical protein n=1 Tax=uncultured Megasphaera sp. TaxID=165188 RepID=UPI00262A0D34|nr:hypothetical protein [uncultured Megasphaera sp.]